MELPMRTNIQLAKSLSSNRKVVWADSLNKGDVILVDDVPVVYLSHNTYQNHNGVGGYMLTTKYRIVTKLGESIASDIASEIKPLNE
tara:strand:- start:986 stop:1246 length:261 start_codon:yes stop_codon:yes gene_type:complete